jgi:hypothetical protein
MVFPSVFAIVVGLGMIGQWVASYRSRNIPELSTEPIRIWFHIAAEMATAMALVLAGIGLVTAQPWSKSIYPVAIGMLFYTAIVSPGYFAQRGQWLWLGLFALLIVLGVISLAIVLS